MNVNEMREFFEECGEFYAVGYFEEPYKTPFERFSRALRRYLENYRLPEYKGEPLYPCGGKYRFPFVNHDFSFTVSVDWRRLGEKSPAVKDALWGDFWQYGSRITGCHTVGGNMYTHSYPNFRRIVFEGLDSYEERIKNIEDASVREGLLDLMVGIRCFHSRIMQKLTESGAGESELYKAFTRVPFQPARTLYEALVCWNFVYYLDGCDDIGRMDADLISLYKGEDMTEVFRCFFKNVDANSGWSGTLGPDYNALTLQCLKACKGIRRPSLELRVKSDMPEEIWAAAIEAIHAGGGSPSLYNASGYQGARERLFPHVPAEDRIHCAGGGCTETMLAGMSNVGSLDAGINTAYIFHNVMRRFLVTSRSFDEFYDAFIREYTAQAENVMDSISESQRLRSQFRPHPMRTLLIDDCIERGKDFNNGGARYYWSVVNLAGMINVIDSMVTIKKLIFDNGAMTAAELLQRLDAGERVGKSGVAHHGADCDEANEMAARLSRDLCAVFETKTPYMGGKFLPSSIQFTTYINAGKSVGATPDGRLSGEPLCDSIGAINGNDVNGVTAMLNSAASLCQSKMAGTPVLNLKLDSKLLPLSLKGLVNGYFAQGGMQMQVTCVSREELLDAEQHPEKYPNLVVRIGGYSEYFSRLSTEHRRSVIERTCY
ncbi:MAG: hypothetical protein IJY04_03220 [Clostridia bacterium]|nr:hypothetical protein [Clostridia bacterium]